MKFGVFGALGRALRRVQAARSAHATEPLAVEPAALFGHLGVRVEVYNQCTDVAHYEAVKNARHCRTIGAHRTFANFFSFFWFGLRERMARTLRLKGVFQAVPLSSAMLNGLFFDMRALGL